MLFSQISQNFSLIFFFFPLEFFFFPIPFPVRFSFFPICRKSVAGLWGKVGFVLQIEYFCNRIQK